MCIASIGMRIRDVKKTRSPAGTQPDFRRIKRCLIWFPLLLGKKESQITARLYFLESSGALYYNVERRPDSY